MLSKSNSVKASGAAFLFLIGLCMCSCSSHTVEETRVTSPDDRVDAVMTRVSSGGTMGSFEWRIYIVSKGKAATNRLRPVFSAGTLSHEKIAWKRAHLLEIQYDVAYIENFRNVWALSEVENSGPAGPDYYVEIRLAPSQPDFSIVSPDGQFRH